jgi:hypothetical protein
VRVQRWPVVRRVACAARPGGVPRRSSGPPSVDGTVGFVQYVDPDPHLVWHYTSSAGLLGILSRDNAHGHANKLKWPYALDHPGACTLRFTDALYLNDPLELEYGRKHLANVLRERLPDLVGDDRRELDDVLAWLVPPDHPSQDDAEDEMAGGTYVACFSADSDSLSQWRGYASGQGYAIGFDTERLYMLFPPLTEEPPEGWTRDFGTSFQADHVKYGDAAALEYFRGYADLIINPPSEKLGETIPRRYLTELALSMVKQEAYRVESEVRAVIVQGPIGLHHEFRDGALGVTPYITAAFLPYGVHTPAPLIRAVKVGPGGDAKLRKQAVSRLLENEDFDTDHIDVSASGFEYRGW